MLNDKLLSLCNVNFKCSRNPFRRYQREQPEQRRLGRIQFSHIDVSTDKDNDDMLKKHNNVSSGGQIGYVIIKPDTCKDRVNNGIAGM